jgi:hypothetical protein
MIRKNGLALYWKALKKRRYVKATRKDCWKKDLRSAVHWLAWSGNHETWSSHTINTTHATLVQYIFPYLCMLEFHVTNVSLDCTLHSLVEKGEQCIVPKPSASNLALCLVKSGVLTGWIPPASHLYWCNNKYITDSIYNSTEIETPVQCLYI